MRVVNSIVQTGVRCRPAGLLPHLATGSGDGVVTTRWSEPVERPGRASLRVMLIGGSPTDGALVTGLLGRDHAVSFATHAAPSMEEALAELTRCHYDCVLLDLQGGNGTDLGSIRTLRAAAPLVPVVVLTTDGTADATEALGMGAQDHLVKGRLNVDVLTRAVHYAIERHHMHRTLEMALSETRSTLALLRESDRRRAQILASMHEGLVHQDAGGSVVEVNPAAARLLGVPAEELIGRTSLEMIGRVVHEDGTDFAPEDQPSTLARLTGRRAEAVMGFHLLDGGFRWILVHAEPLGDGGTVATMVDLTDERERARQLEASEHRYRTLSDLCPDPIFVIDADNRYLYVNPSASQLIGHLVEEMVGEVGDYRPAHAEGTAALAERRRRILGGEVVHAALERYVQHDGRVVDVEVSSAPVEYEGRPAVLSFVRDVTARQAQYGAVAASESRHRTTINAIGEGIILWNRGADGTFEPVLSNPAATALLGADWSESGDGGAGSQLVVVDADGREMADADGPFEVTVRTGRAVEAFVCGLMRPDRPIVWTRVTTRPIFDEDGAFTGIVGSLSDITAEREARREVARTHDRYEALVVHSSDIVMIEGADGGLEYASPALRGVLGLDPATVLGSALLDLAAEEDRAALASRLEQVRAEPGRVTTFTTRMAHGDGTWRHLEVILDNRLADPAVQGILANCRDVTERVVASEHLRRQALYDHLTGLPNRALLLDHLDSALARAERSGKRCALLYLDLDRFKNVNDSMGHGAGDRLLVTVAQRLQAAVRASDTVARLSGDEFVVLAEDVGDESTVIELAERVRASVTAPIDLGERTLSIGISIGIALAEGHKPEALLQEGDTALYRAKERGRNRWVMYEQSMRTVASRRLDTETRIHEALESERMVALFQPIVTLSDGRPVGAEALVRIRQPDGGLLAPDQFIEVAEDTGLIVPIGMRMLEQACRQASEWKANGAETSQVSVNISARQLASRNLPLHVAAALRRHGLSARDLCLELTETTLIDADTPLRTTIEDLHDQGVTIAIDDFGTGWCSLAYLRRFPVDVLKIDRTFVAGLEVNAQDSEVVKAIIGLGHALDLTIVAEGIETPRQAELLSALGCDLAQGYLYGRPGPGTPQLSGLLAVSPVA